MIRGLYTSSAGMQVEALRQEALANNLANLNTSGFKRDMSLAEARKNMTIMRTNNPLAKGPLAGTQRVAIGDLGTGVMMDHLSKRFDQGNMQQTENPLDLALEGDGFFTVRDEQGRALYTRAGDFTRASDGRIVDKEGRALQGEGGDLVIPPVASGKLQLGLDGILSVEGKAVDRLAIARFEDPDAQLERAGDTAFRAHAGAEPGSAWTAAKPPQLRQGFLEQANVNSVREMVEMITALRQYEANQKAIQHQDETLARAVNDIAKA